MKNFLVSLCALLMILVIGVALWLYSDNIKSKLKDKLNEQTQVTQTTDLVVQLDYFKGDNI